MSKQFFIGVSVVLLAIGGLIAWWMITTVSEQAIISQAETRSFTEQEAGFEAEPPIVTEPVYRVGQGGWYTLEELRTWERAPGPLRVGVQVGHLDNDEVPEELSGLTRNGAGATAAGYNERDTVAVIAGLVAELLKAEGVEVDVLPATVPPKYEADAFISIHADGNLNTATRGFKIAGPRRDYSGKSAALVADLETAYAEATNLPQDPQITRRMSAYYAFNWPRYEHAIHPFTPAAIVETGFLTNPNDRALLLNEPDTVAAGIANGVLAFLATDPPMSPPPASLTAPTLPLSGTVDCAPVRTERLGRSNQPCVAALRDVAGHYYYLASEPPLATSSLPYQATVDGRYMPVQMLDNYFWFHFEVRGVIDVTELERVE